MISVDLTAMITCIGRAECITKPVLHVCDIYIIVWGKHIALQSSVMNNGYTLCQFLGLLHTFLAVQHAKQVFPELGAGQTIEEEVAGIVELCHGLGHVQNGIVLERWLLTIFTVSYVHEHDHFGHVDNEGEGGDADQLDG